MALTEVQRAQVDKLLTAYCAKRVPPAVQPKVRLGYRIEGNAVILFEERPAFQPPHDWQELVIAKFTYVGTKREWQLYCQHRDLRWHSYQALPAASSFAKLLDEVDADPTGIFWG
ncbi:MAG: hypothetical protein DMD80_23995 [Candidatus Rokuibacteriota bacterium]|nr:MAG: hypothetical protein DMD80_23995 [Candidatus Rokubacteria bacterium]